MMKIVDESIDEANPERNQSQKAKPETSDAHSKEIVSTVVKMWNDKSKQLHAQM